MTNQHDFKIDIASNLSLHNSTCVRLVPGADARFAHAIQSKLSIVSASFIFRANQFDRGVVTHSLSDFNFHDHRPIVKTDQHLLWVLKLTINLKF